MFAYKHSKLSRRRLETILYLPMDRPDVWPQVFEYVRICMYVRYVCVDRDNVLDWTYLYFDASALVYCSRVFIHLYVCMYVCMYVCT